ncbi:signal peptide peptidase SppA [Haloferula helveola]|uniref:Signal peptide peptidase SppA n=1 Tax=Haloferula helveola TaxID=490095 RepID=A0ABM7REM5_9BACT|nr:signal peptide peptidase SppA [Haloferula helveola]
MKSPLLILAATASFALADEKPIVAVYDLEGPLSESGVTSNSMFSMEFSPERPLTFHDLTRGLKMAAADPEVTALVLDVDGATLGLAQLEELRGHLADAREAGKDVWLYSDYYSNKSALLGSAANHFVLMPEAGVDFAGIASESMYFKGLLDKAGLQADVIHIGDFKSFGEEFYRTGPSEFAAKQTEELIDGIFSEITGTVAEGRKLEREKVLSLVDRGTFTASDAKEAGLVDDLQYRTDFNAKLREEYAEAKFDREYGLPDLDGPDLDSIFDVFKLMMSSADDSKSKDDYVAVVALEGGISDQSIAPVRAAIVKLLKDEHAKAMVLRVDSPGGSALSSEVLWEATDEWKAAGRPFAVSMGGVAASGGYYVSAGADRIFAEPGTITGSIGVVGMKFVMAGAMDKLGITTHTIQRGKHADAMSMTEPFSDEEAAIIRQSMLDVYGTFKKRITDGRGDRLKGELEPMAGGRVYTGRKALELGLVDELGGLTDAIEWAAKEAGIEGADSKLRPEPKSAFEGMFSKPEKNKDGELVRMSSRPAPAADAVRAIVREAGLTALPEPARISVGRAMERIQAIQESRIQLIGPDVRIGW